MRKLVIICGLIAFALVACGGPKQASDANFKQAINDDLTKAQLYIEILSPLPVDMPDYALQDKFTGQRYPSLERAGLLRSSVITISNPPATGGYNGRGTRFELTDLGKKLAVPATWDPKIMHFVYAKKAVHSIENWTDPGNGNMVKVTYTYELDDVSDWAKRADVQSACGIDEVFAKAFGGSKTEQQTVLLILTNNGWEVKN
jgi:hypothetical protein